MRLLRNDIIISPRRDESGCILLDQQTGEEYEFGEMEHFLLERFQQPYDLGKLCSELNTRFGLNHSVDDLESFLNLLDEWSLLRRQETPTLPQPPKLDHYEPETLTGDLGEELKQPNRWHWFNPERLFDGLNYLFPTMRWAVWLAPIIVAVGVSTMFLNANAFQTDFSIAKNYFGTVTRLVLNALTLNIATQFARGMLARHIGLATPSFGVLLAPSEIGFLPRLNVQIVRGGKLERGARLLFLGLPALIRFWFFGVMSLLWAITRPSGTFMSVIALEFALMSVFSLLFVANPFWRGDGSSFLSAWLETPGNIRQSSFKALIGFVFGRPAAIARYSRHNVWLGLFGLIALAMFCGYLGFVVYTLFHYLESKFHGFGVALFLIFGAYAGFSLHLNKTWNKAAQASKVRNKQAGSSRSQAGAGASASDRAARINRGSTVKKTKPWGRYLLFIIVLVVLFQPYQSEPGGSTEVFPAARSSISLDTDGLLEKINFNGGEQVKAGTVLAEVTDYNQWYALRILEADIDSQKYKIKQYETTPSVEDIKLAQEKIRTASLQAIYSDEKLKRQEGLVSQGFISSQALADVRILAVHDQQALDEAVASLESLKAQINPYQIQSMKADLIKMQREADYDREKLRRTKLVSPIDGRIITTDLQYLRNSFLKAGNKFADIEDQRTVIVHISVPEADVKDISVGARVTLKLYAYSDREFVGKVEEIPPVTSTTSSTTSSATSSTSVSNRYIQVSGRMDNSGGLLLTGLTGYAKITGNKTIVLLAFTDALVRFVTIDMWSWLP